MSNRCSVSNEKLIDFLLDELTYEETVEMDSHIRDCEHCKQRSDAQMQLFRAVRSQETAEVPAATYFQLKNRVFSAERTNSRPLMMKLQLVFSAAAVLIMTVLLTGSVYFSEIPANTPILYESWIIDSSFVNTDLNGDRYYDSLEYLINELNFGSDSIFSPVILLKTEEAVISKDQFIEHYRKNNSGFRETYLYPWITPPQRLISLNRRRMMGAHIS